MGAAVVVSSRDLCSSFCLWLCADRCLFVVVIDAMGVWLVVSVSGYVDTRDRVMKTKRRVASSRGAVSS